MAETDAAPRMKASDFHPYILEIFDGYVHGKLTKREFITEAGKFAAAGVTGLMILNQLAPDYALAQQVKADDPSIITKKVVVPSPEGHGTINGLLARPANAKGKLPAVLVIHENRGLNPYIEDVARRLAKAGFLALAPDGLTSAGGCYASSVLLRMLLWRPQKRTARAWNGEIGRRLILLYRPSSCPSCRPVLCRRM